MAGAAGARRPDSRISLRPRTATVRLLVDLRTNASGPRPQMIFEEDRACRTVDLPRLPGKPARPLGGSSCFWAWQLLHRIERDSPDLRSLRGLPVVASAP